MPPIVRVIDMTGTSLPVHNVGDTHRPPIRTLFTDLGEADGRRERLALPCLADDGVKFVDLLESQTLPKC